MSTPYLDYFDSYLSYLLDALSALARDYFLGTCDCAVVANSMQDVPFGYIWSSEAKMAGPYLLSAGFQEVETDWTLLNAKKGDILITPASWNEVTLKSHLRTFN